MLLRRPFGSRSTRRPRLHLLIVVTLITLVVALWYLLRYQFSDEHDVRWYPPSSNITCNLHEMPCSVELGELGRMQLAIPVEGPIKPLVPLPVEVRLDGIEADKVMVSFEGADMDMGTYRFPLGAESAQHFVGEGQLSICTRESMDWRIRVVLDTDQGKVGSWFDLSVERSLP
ncbi:hypothetical protein [Halomonas huangheensis]|uniref:YtkA-like domain-containing protein n=1 Tax=Halomonas huangheensis TaxID=1178482 RepID=W1N6W8_9GAMM|nr:hypothetical protein [Halomonas huangheensis]ALM50995.1 hypothetical protein AR456_00805 [Halomonas huangheensis]ERL51263.1 hypothetical protein BJB45_15280 [Halomonas huangheensis]